MASFEKAQVIKRIVENADKNKDQIIETKEKKLLEENIRLADGLHNFSVGNKIQQQALNNAIADVVGVYRGVSAVDIKRWISFSEQPEIQKSKEQLTPQQKRLREWKSYSERVKRKLAVPDSKEINRQVFKPIVAFCNNMLKPMVAHNRNLARRIKEMRNMGFFEFSGPSNYLSTITSVFTGKKSRFEAELNQLVKLKSKEEDKISRMRFLIKKLASGNVDFKNISRINRIMGRDLRGTPEGDLVMAFIKKLSKGENFIDKEKQLAFYNYYRSKGSEYKIAIGDFSDRISDEYYNQAKKIAQNQLHDSNLAKRAKNSMTSGFGKFHRDYLAKYAEPFLQWDSLAIMAVSGGFGRLLAKSKTFAKVGIKIGTILSKSPKAAQLIKFLPGVSAIGTRVTTLGKLAAFLPNMGIEMGKFMVYEAAAQKIGGKSFGKAVAYACMFVPGFKSGFQEGIVSRVDYAKLMSKYNPIQLEKEITTKLITEAQQSLGRKLTTAEQVKINDSAKVITTNLAVPKPISRSVRYRTSVSRRFISRKSSAGRVRKSSSRKNGVLKRSMLSKPTKSARYRTSVAKRPSEGRRMKKVVSRRRDPLKERTVPRSKMESKVLDSKIAKIDKINQKNKGDVIKRLTEGLDDKEIKVFMETYLDPMTGMLNRQGLRLLDKVIMRGKRTSILSFDGDHFKALNDATSTLNGDYIIKLMGSKFHKMIKSLQKQGFKTEGVRMGGEEFVVFSSAPKDVLATAMRGMSKELKRAILKHLTRAQKLKMARLITASKYTGDSNGFKKAMAEIGGSTSGISEIGIGNIKNPSKIRESLLQYVDSFLEHGKKSRRGRVYIDKRSVASASDTIKKFSAKNSLPDHLNVNLSVIDSSLKDIVHGQFLLKIPQAKALIGENPKFASILENYFGLPDFSKKVLREIAKKTGISADKLMLAKREYMLAVRNYGTYTGASTMTRLSSALKLKGSGYKAVKTIELGEFKSINEIMGHTYGDMFLTHTYQKVIMDTVRVHGLSSKIIVAQKGANFKFALHESVTQQQANAFRKALQENYKKSVQDLFRKIDTGKIEPVQDIRVGWLKQNKSSTLQQSIGDQYSLTIN